MSLRFHAPFAAIVAVLVLSACKSEEPPPPPPRTARVIEAVPAPLLLAAEGSGTIASRTNTSVGFLVSGRLDTRDVDVGDTVTAGQTIAAIDPTDLQNQLDFGEERGRRRECRGDADHGRGGSEAPAS